MSELLSGGGQTMAGGSPPETRMVVFAHVPPPHHGQSAMVKLMLDLLQCAPGNGTATSPANPLRLFHVNARLSREMDDVGSFQLRKIPSLLGYCAQAIWLRRRHAAPVLYYVPAPPARVPLRRDLLALAICRPFFPKLVLHWHAGGLAEWLETQAHPWEKRWCRRLLAQPDLSVVLRPFNRRDGEYFHSRRIEVIPNGIPDPCPDYVGSLEPHRIHAPALRRRTLAACGQGSRPGPPDSGPVVYRALFLSFCRREKGLFDALDAVALANAELRGTPLRVELTVAGEFWSPLEREEFDRRLQAPDLQRGTPLVRYVGFASGAVKERLLRESDCLCFPTYLPEGFPVVLAEAMAYGLPPIISNWRQLPEILPAGYRGVIEPRSPASLAAKLIEFARQDYDPGLREHFLANYTGERFAERLRAAFLSVNRA